MTNERRTACEIEFTRYHGTQNQGPWVMRHKWENLMCMHIPVDPKALSIYVPDPLDLDLYDGYAWLSIFTFNVRHMGLGNLPKFPYFHQFLELNVRTCVKYNNVPGVYFFSLDAAKFLPVSGGRLLTLPYFKARMKSIKKAGWTHFSSRRQPGNTPYLQARYKAISEPGIPSPGSLDHWLFERYYLYNTTGGTVFNIGIHHMPWRPAKASVVYDRHALSTLLPGELRGTQCAPIMSIHWTLSYGR